MSKQYQTSNSIIGNFYNGSTSKPYSASSGSYSGDYKNNSSSKYSSNFSDNPNMPKGLQNLTNTCYISAVLQILFPIVTEKDFPSPNKYKNDVSYHFFQLKKSKSRTDYRLFKQVLEEKIQIVRGWEQQDAHELLVHLLQQLRKQNQLPLKSGKLDLNYKQEFNFEKNWQFFQNEMLKLQNSKIIQLFSGQILKRLTCDKDHPKHILQRFNNMSVSFPEKNTSFFHRDTLKLDKMIKDYFAAQIIQDLFCEKCKCKQTFKKYSAIYSGPKYLILHLSRFIKGYFQNQKNDTQVQFDSTLCLNSFKEQNIRYKLVGIIHHTGSLNRGHYYADVLVSGEWYQMNDQKVYRQNIKQKSNISSTVYLLVYQKY